MSKALLKTVVPLLRVVGSPGITRVELEKDVLVSFMTEYGKFLEATKEV